jgi:WD40 repeat protein
VVHTEKSLKVLAPDPYQTSYDFPGQSVDKVVHASLRSGPDGGHMLSIITAHNFLEVWRLGESPSLINRNFCEEECILYSADMNSQGLIAAGTVFQSILIWKESAVILKLEGHEGVIFDVQFLRDDFLASVSDDRSLRLWRLGEGLLSYQQVATFYGHRSRVWKVR